MGERETRAMRVGKIPVGPAEKTVTIKFSGGLNISEEVYNKYMYIYNKYM